MTCGITVAPRMPVASSRLSVPSKRGTRPSASGPTGTSIRSTVREEPEQDDAEQPGDGQLERAVAAALQREQRERHDARDHAAGEQRDAEQQVQRDRAADHLGEVGGDGHQLGLHPHEPRHRAREGVAAHLGQVAAGGHAELRGEGLDQHRDEVRRDDHPQQQEAVVRAGGEVGGEVAGVDVGDGGDEGGAEERDRSAHTAPLPDLADRRRGRVGRRHVFSSSRAHRRGRAGSGGRRARRSGRRSRTHSGPPNGSCRSTVRTTPGRTPSSPRWRSAALSRSDTRRTRKRAPGDDGVQADAPPLVVRAVPRRDRVAVRVVGRVAERGVDALLEPLGQHVLQQLGLGVHLVPRHAEHLVEERLQQPVAPHDAQRGPLARLGEPQLATARAVDELALLQPLDHGRHRGRRDAQLGREQPGGDRLTAVGDVVDRLEVVLARAATGRP